MNLYFGDAERVHLIGIKGVGMTALAHILKEEGYTVTGTDTSEQFFTDRILRTLNIRVVEGFSPLNIPPKAELVIHSAAYSPENNPELAEAVRMNMQTLSYPEALGRISEKKFSIGVSGSHGKTTTTAMVGTVFNALGLDPTIIAGSAMANFGGFNARYGLGDVLVAETCEYRRHFLNFAPQCIVITNIDEDHLDYFKDLQDICDAFKSYIAKLPESGLLVANNDDPSVRDIISQIDVSKLKVSTFGMKDGAQWTARDITFENGLPHFTACLNGEPKVQFSLPVPGEHNVSNALAAFACSYEIFRSNTDETEETRGLQTIAEALENFQGTARRLEKKGSSHGAVMYDDYAHHPTEIRATLKAVRAMHPKSKIWAVFMPHTYSRTQALMREFATSFSDADAVIINKTYGSVRETSTSDSDSATLAEAIKKNHPDVHYIPEFEKTADVLRKNLSEGDVLITLGAGDNWRVGEMLLAEASGSS